MAALASPVAPCRCGRNAFVEDTCIFCGTGEGAAPVISRRPRHPARPSARHVTDRRAWTERLVIAAIRRWYRETGRTPRQQEWARGGAWWPSTARVVGIFPTWKAAIRAAGYEPPAQGRRPREPPAQGRRPRGS